MKCGQELDYAGYDHVKIFVSGGLTLEQLKPYLLLVLMLWRWCSYISAAQPIDTTMDLKEVDGKASEPARPNSWFK